MFEFMKRKCDFEKRTVDAVEAKVAKTVRETLTAFLDNVEDSDAFAKKVKELKQEIAELKSTKKIEEAEIKHLVRMKEEKLMLAHEKKGIELAAEFQERTMQLQQEYHDKVLEQIDLARKEQKETYTEIMKRLPNVNVEVIKKTR